jgi:hypothetical protein
VGTQKKGCEVSKITESARGEDCQVRIPYVCNFNPETTVWAHANGLAAGKARGLKSPDPLGAYACSKCHDVIDGRVRVPGLSYGEVQLAFHEGHQRSFIKLVEKGLVNWK